MTSNLEKIRVSKGLSQSKLEELSGVHQQTISRIENGRPLTKLTTAQALAQALGCKVSDLMDIDPGADTLWQKSSLHSAVFLKAIREYAGITPRKMAVFLNITEKEYLDLEKKKELSKDVSLSLLSVILFSFLSSEISNTLSDKEKETGLELSDKETQIIELYRNLDEENQERLLNLIKAVPLIK